jgi:hypothetical protein
MSPEAVPLGHSESSSPAQEENNQTLICGNQDAPKSGQVVQDTSGAKLLCDLRDVIKRYVVLPDMAAETLALWIVHTYAFTLRQVTTYIAVVSPEKRCGKTTLLELLGLLANRSLTAANISPSAMFRVIQETQPTLLIDEADTFLQGRDELAGILNAGYRKGNSYVVRVAERKTRRADESIRPTNGRMDHQPAPSSPNTPAGVPRSWPLSDGCPILWQIVASSLPCSAKCRVKSASACGT